MSPCPRHLKVQALLSPDRRASPPVLHHPIMSQRSQVPPSVYPAQAPNYQPYAYPAPSCQSYVYPTPAPNYQSSVYPAPAPNYRSVRAPTSTTSSPPAASYTVHAATPSGAPPAPASVLPTFSSPAIQSFMPTSHAPAVTPAATQPSPLSSSSGFVNYQATMGVPSLVQAFHPSLTSLLPPASLLPPSVPTCSTHLTLTQRPPSRSPPRPP